MSPRVSIAVLACVALGAGRAWAAADAPSPATPAARPATSPEARAEEAAPGHAPPDSEKFTFVTEPVPDALWARMQGTSWHPARTCNGHRRACPARADLVLVTTRHWDLAGRAQIGRLVVARSAAASFRALLEAWWRQGFPIARMEPVSTFGGDDARSMAANNTSAFNCRCTTGGSRLSNHASGHALDVNPVQNPYVSGRRVLPPAGEAYADREDVRPGMLVPGSAAVEAALEGGFAWGGHWRSLKDWQHLELRRDPRRPR